MFTIEVDVSSSSSLAGGAFCYCHDVAKRLSNVVVTLDGTSETDYCPSPLQSSGPDVYMATRFLQASSRQATKNLFISSKRCMFHDPRATSCLNQLAARLKIMKQNLCSVYHSSSLAGAVIFDGQRAHFQLCTSPEPLIVLVDHPRLWLLDEILISPELPNKISASGTSLA